MKTTYWLGFLLLFFFSCNKEKNWNIPLEKDEIDLHFTNISQDFFDTNIPLEKLHQKYPFFFDSSVDDNIWERQRKDSLERAVFKATEQLNHQKEIQKDMKKLFARFHYFFPNELIPTVYFYSSGLQNIHEPVLYGSKEGMIFIALDGFLGQDNALYQHTEVYPYLLKNMNNENILPTVVQAIGREIVPFNPRQQTFVDLMIDEGKKMILEDALLPDASDALKIGFSPEHLEWAIANEAGIWNYFVEQNILFDTDRSYRERFLQAAPFSKFLNEIELDSPGRIGVWIGWQICRKFLKENPDMSLQEFIHQDTQSIFKAAKYKPKKGDGDYAPLKKASNDEVEKYE